jgi:hypothetical protein
MFRTYETAKMSFKFMYEMAAMGAFYENESRELGVGNNGGMRAYEMAHMSADHFYRFAGLDF